MTFLAGFRSGLRLVAKQPALGLSCVLLLGAGMALAATLLSVVYGVLIRPVPFDGANRWLHVKSFQSADDGSGLVSPEEFLHWQRFQKSFETLTAYSMFMSFVTAESGSTEVYVSAEVTSELLSLTGARPLSGRWIQPADELPGAPDVAVIGFQLWQRHFLPTKFSPTKESHREPSDEELGDWQAAVGATISINGRPATVIGVAPEGFAFPHSQQLWLPLRLKSSDPGREGYLNVFGVPVDGAAAGRTELEALSGRLVEGPGSAEPRAPKVVVEPFVKSQADPRLKTAVIPMMIAILAVFGLACLNVAGLMLARAIRNRRQTAIRVALGALPGRLTVFALGEAAALATIAAGLGLAGASILITGVGDFLNRGNVLRGFWAEARLDPWVLVAVLGLALASTWVAAALPAWWAGHTRPTDILRHGSSGNTSGKAARIADLLVIVEVALATILLVISLLMVGSIRNLSAVEMGFRAEHRMVAKVSLLQSSDADSIQAFFDQVRQRLLELPDVEQVGFASTGPVDGSFWAEMTTATAEPSGEYSARWSVVSSSYFETIGVELLDGRGFSDPLDPPGGPPTAIVNRSFAEQHLATGHAVGQKVRWVGEDATAYEVVGVVEDMVMGAFDEGRSAATLYLPSSQRPRPSMVMVVAGRDVTPTPERIRGEVARVDRTAGCFDIKPLAEVVRQRRWLYDGFAGLFGMFGLVSLALTLAGLYALVVAASRRRTQEYGIRMALGAGPKDLVFEVVRMGALRLGFGVGLGVLLALPITAWVEVLLFEVPPTDPRAFVGAVALMWVCGLHAVTAPAVEASRIDPSSTLRSQ